MEQILVIGHIGKDAEIKISNGNEFVSFTLAASFNYKDEKGTKISKTNWYNVISKNKEIAKYLKKGIQVFVQGRPSYNLYKNKEGVNCISCDINSDKIQLLTPKEKEENN